MMLMNRFDLRDPQRGALSRHPRRPALVNPLAWLLLAGGLLAAGITDPPATLAQAVDGGAPGGMVEEAVSPADTTEIPLVRSLIKQGTSVAEHARTLTETEDITAEQFWRRRSLEFNFHSLEELWQLLRNLPGRTPEILQIIRQRPGPLSLFIGLTLVTLVLTIVLRRQFTVRLAREVGQSLHPLRRRLPSQISTVIVSVVRFLTSILAAWAVLGVYHLARGLSGLEDPWFRGLGDFLLGWAILATALAILHELLLGGLLSISREHGRLLYRDFRRITLIGFLGLVSVALAERAGAPVGVLNLGRFAVKLAMLLTAALALRRRDAVLDLFPPFENRAYEIFLAWLRRFYGPAVLFTLVVLCVGLVGYGRVAGFLLIRSWVLVGIFVLTVGVHSGVLSVLRRLTLGQGAPAPEAKEFYRSTVLLVTYITVIGVGTLFLHILGLLSPISRLLSAEIASAGDYSFNALVFIKAIAAILIFVFVGRLICRYLDFQVYPALHVDPGVSTAIDTMIMWLLIFLGTIISLNTVGLDLRLLTLMAGGLGIGIGFGLQNFANNLVSGMTLIFGRNLRRGDYVTVGDNEGFVQHVGIRVTRIRTRDAIEYTIPNSAFLENMIINWSHTSPLVRAHVPIGVSYNADPAHVREVLLEVAAGNKWVEPKPAPAVWFAGFGNSSIDFELLVWINVRRVAQEEMASQIFFAAFAALKEHGIEIPFPQRDLHIRSGLHQPGAMPDAPLPCPTAPGVPDPDAATPGSDEG